jgi:hypothetical protein
MVPMKIIRHPVILVSLDYVRSRILFTVPEFSVPEFSVPEKYTVQKIA